MLALSVGIFSLLACNWKVESFSQDFVYEDLNGLPANQVGLVLGTSKYLKEGGINPYFRYRIEAAVALYKAGKVRYILVSGDNNTMHYNEPRDMRKELIMRGIPKEAIFMDFAGFRTLDSVVRCKEVFGQHQFTIISQEFHNKRAVYISRQHGIEAIAFNARDVSVKSGMRVLLREALARVKTFIDLYVVNAQPKFLGEAVRIG
jgi:SanA protein